MEIRNTPKITLGTHREQLAATPPPQPALSLVARIGRALTGPAPARLFRAVKNSPIGKAPASGYRYVMKAVQSASKALEHLPGLGTPAHARPSTKALRTAAEPGSTPVGSADLHIRELRNYISLGGECSFRNDWKYQLFTDPAFLAAGNETSLANTSKDELGIAVCAALLDKAEHAEAQGHPYPLETLKAEFEHIFAVLKPQALDQSQLAFLDLVNESADKTSKGPELPYPETIDMDGINTLDDLAQAVRPMIYAAFAAGLNLSSRAGAESQRLFGITEAPAARDEAGAPQPPARQALRDALDYSLNHSSSVVAGFFNKTDHAFTQAPDAESRPLPRR